jgi:carbon-monoxide dehydrogenase medium subunit
VRIPVPAPGTTAAYEKYRTRSSEDRPCVGVFAATRLDSGRLEELRVAVGAASETPQRFPDLEAAAAGRPLDEALAAEVAEGYAERIDTLDDMRGSAWYRTEMIRVWVRRTILRAAGMPE